MDEFALIENNPDVEIYLATVTEYSLSGVRIKLDGQDEAMTKRYKMLRTTRHLEVGDRVVVLKISGSYVVLGAVSAPIYKSVIYDLPTSSSTSLIVSRFNLLLSALRTQGIIG